MNQRNILIRKLTYVGGMIVMLVCITLVAQPSVHSDPDGKGGSKGGMLAVKREEMKLGQTSLGEIDPASETLKLVTLGLRGVAATFLWDEAIEAKKKQNWEAASAAAQQIIKIEPNFYAVWDFQAHNLSYNISVEFDDYRDRYWWVRKGIDFLILGTRYNDNEPRLTNTIGWYVCNKIGKSDEHVQFRKLFKKDDDFPRNRGIAPEDRDNWLAGFEYYKEAQNQVDRGAILRGKGESLFNSDPPMARINYAMAIEKDGVFGKKAQAAWESAKHEWELFGNRRIATSYGLHVSLGQKEELMREVKRLEAEIDKLVPGIRDELREKKKSDLSKDERTVLAIDVDKLDPEQKSQIADINRLIEPKNDEIVATIQDQAVRDKAVALAGRAVQAANIALVIDSPRGIINWDYWKARCDSEPLPETLEAREALYNADRALQSKANFPEAKKLYERGFEQWDQVLKKFPRIREDSPTADDLAEQIDRYRALLQNEYPKDYQRVFIDNRFVLQDVLELANNTNPDRARAKAASQDKPEPKNKADRKSTEKPTPPTAKTDGSSSEKPAEQPADKTPDASTSKPKEDKPKVDKPRDDKLTDGKLTDGKPGEKSSSKSPATSPGKSDSKLVTPGTDAPPEKQPTKQPEKSSDPPADKA